MTDKDDRAERLRRALRENLRRRKGQRREVAGEPPIRPEEPPEA